MSSFGSNGKAQYDYLFAESLGGNEFIPPTPVLRVTLALRRQVQDKQGFKISYIISIRAAWDTQDSASKNEIRPGPVAKTFYSCSRETEAGEFLRV